MWSGLLEGRKGRGGVIGQVAHGLRGGEVVQVRWLMVWRVHRSDSSWSDGGSIGQVAHGPNPLLM